MKNIIKKSLLLVLVPTLITLSFNHTVAFAKANAEQITDKNDMVRLATLAYGKDSSTTMTFTWNSTNFTNSIVEISEGTFDASTAKKYEGTIEISKASSEDGYIHRVIASDLTPDTTYQYRVGDPTLHTSEIGTFKTSSLNNKSFSFMHISDPQGISDADYLSYNSLLKTVSSSFSFDFFALTGDIVNNSWKDHNPNLTQWENALTLQHEVIKDYPIMAVAGNHEAADYDFSSRFTYETTDKDKKSGVYYSFVYEGVYFLALNTNDALDEEPGSSLSEEQLSFIEADLEAHKDAKWKIVLMHKGLFDAGAHASNLAEEKDYDIKSVLERAKENREVDYEIDRHRKINNTQIDILKSIKIREQKQPVDDDILEPIDELNTEEKTLVDLIQNIQGSKTENKKDLFADLMGDPNDTMVLGQKDELKEMLLDMTQDLEAIKEPANEFTQEINMEKMKMLEEDDDEDYDVDEEDTDDSPSIKEVDKSFYTNSIMFDKNDFEGFDELEKESKKSSFLAKIAVLIVVLMLLGTVFLIANFVFDLNLI